MIGSCGQETQHLHLAYLLCRSMRHSSADVQACCYLSHTNRYQASCSGAFFISRLSKVPIGVLAASKSQLRCHTRGYCGYMACEYIHGRPLLKACLLEPRTIHLCCRAPSGLYKRPSVVCLFQLAYLICTAGTTTP